MDKNTFEILSCQCPPDHRRDLFVETFAYQSNLIDPQPGHQNKPGDPHFDDHINAIDIAIDMAELGRIVSPHLIHKNLMRNLLGMYEHAGRFRTCGVMVGGRICPDWRDIPDLMMSWKRQVEYCIDGMQKASYEDKEKSVWELHVAFEQIHPWIDGNGRSGRILMLNHRLLLGLEPIIIKFDERWEYYARF